MKYQIKTATEFTDGFVIDVNNSLWIPIDEGNRNYREYLAWLEEGNVPEEWNPEV
jgi:hypothetical protein